MKLDQKKVVSIVAAFAAVGGAQAEKPNILWIVTDDRVPMV